MFNILIRLFRRSRNDSATGVIPVLPKCCRRILLRAIELAENPVVLVNGVRVTDFSPTGPLVREKLNTYINLVVRDGVRPVVGYHDHPREMWIDEAYSDFAVYCASQQWLKIEGKWAQQLNRLGRADARRLS